MLILLIDLLKKIGGKKGKLLRFLHRVGLELEPAVELLQFFETPQAVTFSVFGGKEIGFLFNRQTLVFRYPEMLTLRNKFTFPNLNFLKYFRWPGL